MAKKAPGRPKAATVNLKDQGNAEIDQSTDETKETNEQDLANQKEVSDFPDVSSEVLGDSKEKVATPTAKELELQAEIKKLKAGKIVEVKTTGPKDAKIRPSQLRKQTHTVYVSKKRGDAWGDVQTREMSEPAYNAIAKDLQLRVTLPKNSRLVEPEIKGCKDC